MGWEWTVMDEIHDGVSCLRSWDLLDIFANR